jgi:Spy/CpxP family protein refolding chaperone
LAAAGIALTACAEHRGWRGHDGHRWQQMSPDDAARRIEKMLGWVLAGVDASETQKQRIGEIAQAALKDLYPLRDQHRQARDKALTLLGGADIDRAAIEAIRIEEMALADQASKRFSSALLDAADVLTPEQRGKLIERFKRRLG